jgi:hypothetical protein
MNSKNTYDILKYGSMYPDRIRQIIDLYWWDSRPGAFKDEWLPADVDGTSESMYTKTHFYKIWVYHDNKWQQNLIAFVPNFIEQFPSSKWLQVQMIVINLDVTDHDEDEVYMAFHEYYEELNKICIAEEYRKNFPE